MDLGALFNAVSGVINNRTGPVQDVDTGGFLSEVAGMFRQHADATGQQADFGGYSEQDGQQHILPASMDPYGDPADQAGGQFQGQQILPASMDPYGDPADEGQQILPASMDPYGDPADQRR